MDCRHMYPRSCCFSPFLWALLACIAAAHVAMAGGDGFGGLVCHPDVERALRGNPDLLKGGSCVVSDASGSYVLAGGLGSTVLESGGSQSEAAAWSVAAMDAFRELAFRLHGAVTSAIESDSLTADGQDGSVSGEFLSRMEMKLGATINGATTVGWLEKDNGDCVVFVASRSPLATPIGSLPAVVPRLEGLNPEWRDIVLSRRETHRGGSAWVRKDGADVLLAIGIAEIGDVPTDALSDPACFSSRLRVAELQARAAAISHGALCLESVVAAAIEVRSDEGGLQSMTTDFSAKIQATARESGREARHIKDIGWWVPAEGRFILTAKIVMPE